jgi:hypothetical protein
MGTVGLLCFRGNWRIPLTELASGKQGDLMTEARKHYAAEQKVAILRRYLVEWSNM